ncbi:MAG TPA: preprotein translocase subunit SecG [Planctomycetaceae bacterium]|jgi:preprotein translocase subunit SecG|nr:preprotein translocase subunit SecG [Planctomycetaceae bacterium]
MTHILTDISSIVFLFVGLLLIFVILLQRGRGGGLAGAFGGAGGQSAFGTKAGDVFTRITIGIAVVWVLMAVLTGYAMTYESGKSRFESKVTESKDGGAEGAVEPATGSGATKDNPFEAGSQTKNASPPSKEAPKTTTTPQKSSGPASDKSSPTTKTTPSTAPTTK